MRILTLNCNGLRAAAGKGLFPWLQTLSPDVVCLQETRVDEAARKQHGNFALPGYEAWFRDAAGRPGYSGVALYSRHAPDEIVEGIGHPVLDGEARWLEARFGALSVVSLYLPSGSSSEARQQVKFACLDWLEGALATLSRKRRHFVLAGDFNIAHRPIDLKNWRSNQRNSGFLPEERAWFDRLLATGRWVDAFRHLHPEAPTYTWWSNRGQAYARDVGWRIDYQIVSASLAPLLRSASVTRSPRFADHAPLLVEYDLEPAGRRPGVR